MTVQAAPELGAGPRLGARLARHGRSPRVPERTQGLTPAGHAGAGISPSERSESGDFAACLGNRSCWTVMPRLGPILEALMWASKGVCGVPWRCVLSWQDPPARNIGDWQRVVLRAEPALFGALDYLSVIVRLLRFVTLVAHCNEGPWAVLSVGSSSD